MLLYWVKKRSLNNINSSIVWTIEWKENEATATREIKTSMHGKSWVVYDIIITTAFNVTAQEKEELRSRFRFAHEVLLSLEEMELGRRFVLYPVAWS